MSKFIDYSGLMERTMEDKEVAMEILQCYLEETETCLNKLKDACSSSDLGQTREKAHEIKGSSASAGAEAMREVAEKAQKESENGNLDKVVKLTEELSKVFISTKKEIVDIIG